MHCHTVYHRVRRDVSNLKRLQQPRTGRVVQIQHIKYAQLGIDHKTATASRIKPGNFRSTGIVYSGAVSAQEAE